MSRLSTYLRGSRIASGCSVRQISAATGIGKSTIHRWERGTHAPTLDTCPVLAAALGVETARLVELVSQARE